MVAGDRNLGIQSNRLNETTKVVDGKKLLGQGEATKMTLRRQWLKKGLKMWKN